MSESDVLIIGGGAAGLFAARKIAKKNKKVTLLEARNRLGGRIFTIAKENFSIPIEAGAEFVHGDLPLTLSIIKEAKIPFYSMEGTTYQVKDGKLNKDENFIKGLPKLISKVNQLKKDLPFSEFLDRFLKDEKYKEIRKSVTRFVEGYDAADIRKASTFALSKEWSGEGISSPYRIEGGYSRVVDFISKEIKKMNCIIHLSTIVKEIRWKPDLVEVICDNNKHYLSKKILITVPIGILQSKYRAKAHIHFSPKLTEKQEAINSFGYGSVIKIFFEFKEAFWELHGKNKINQMRNLGFLISDTPFTAWWTQLPEITPILTGWFAGPKVEKIKDMRNSRFLEIALDSLCKIFNTKKSFLQNKLLARYVANWKTDSFSLGAYSFATVESAEGKKILSEPVEDTIYFAGEALSEEEMGTVEAALASGKQAANRILG